MALSEKQWKSIEEQQKKIEEKIENLHIEIGKLVIKVIQQEYSENPKKITKSK